MSSYIQSQYIKVLLFGERGIKSEVIPDNSWACKEVTWMTTLISAKCTENINQSGAYNSRQHEMAAECLLFKSECLNLHSIHSAFQNCTGKHFITSFFRYTPPSHMAYGYNQCCSHGERCWAGLPVANNFYPALLANKNGAAHELFLVT